MRKNLLFLFVLFAFLCSCDMVVRKGENLLAFDESGSGSDSLDILKLESKDAVLFQGGIEFKSIKLPVAAYVNSATGQIAVTWLNPEDEDILREFGGIEISYTLLNTSGDTPFQDYYRVDCPKNMKNFEYSQIMPHYGSRGDMFVDNNEKDATKKYANRKRAWEDAERVHKSKQGAPDEVSGAKYIEKNVDLFPADKKEHLVFNIRSYTDSLTTGEKTYYPITSVVKVVELVTTDSNLGKGYDVARGNYYASTTGMIGLKGKVIDIVKLKNKFKYSMGQVNFNETKQFNIVTTDKKEFITKINEKNGHNINFNMNTEIYGHKFALDFKDTLSSEKEEVISGNSVQYYGLYRGEVIRQHQYVVTQCATADYLRDCVETRCQNYIDDPNHSPEDVFDAYGTHVLLDIYLGGRVDVILNGSYQKDEVTSSLHEVTNRQFAIYKDDSEYTASYGTTTVSYEAKVSSHFVGGRPKAQPIYDPKKGYLVGDVSDWSATIEDSKTWSLIDSPTCEAEEDTATGIWLYATDPKRRQELKEAYLRILFDNYADLLSGITRTKNDKYYVRSFGFVTMRNGDYPSVRYMDNGNFVDESVVDKNDGFAYLNDAGTASEGFGDFAAEILQKKAVALEHAKGNTDVKAADIKFFRKPGSKYLFKIVDARRNVYSDPKVGESSYSVRLSSLRYTHSPDRPKDANEDKKSLGYVFFYPYQVLTMNPKEALMGIAADDLPSNAGVNAKDYNTNARKNDMFDAYGIKSSCEFTSNPSTVDASKKKSLAESWRLASDCVFNTIRRNDGRYTLDGTGDLLENPFDFGYFRYCYDPTDPSKCESYYDFYADGDNVRNKKHYNHREVFYPICDTGFYRESYNHDAGGTFVNNASNPNASWADTHSDWKVNTFLPFVRFYAFDWRRYKGNSSESSHSSKWRAGLLDGHCVKYKFDIDYSDEFLEYTTGHLFNSFYPDKFPLSGTSRISPVVVYTSNKIDEKGNTREYDLAKPIKEIDFAFCKCDSPSAVSPVESISSVEDDWELVPYPIGAGEWVMADSFSTKKTIKAWQPYTTGDAEHSVEGVLENLKNKDPDSGALKSKNKVAGPFSPFNDTQRVSLAECLGPTLYTSLEGNSVRSIPPRAYSVGNMVNKFTKVTSIPTKSLSGNSGAFGFLSIARTDTTYEGADGDAREDESFRSYSSFRTLGFSDRPNYTMQVMVRDMDRYDIYIRFRR